MSSNRSEINALKILLEIEFLENVQRILSSKEAVNDACSANQFLRDNQHENAQMSLSQADDLGVFDPQGEKNIVTPENANIFIDMDRSSVKTLSEHIQESRAKELSLRERIFYVSVFMQASFEFNLLHNGAQQDNETLLLFKSINNTAAKTIDISFKLANSNANPSFTPNDLFIKALKKEIDIKKQLYQEHLLQLIQQGEALQNGSEYIFFKSDFTFLQNLHSIGKIPTEQLIDTIGALIQLAQNPSNNELNYSVYFKLTNVLVEFYKTKSPVSQLDQQRHVLALSGYTDILNNIRKIESRFNTNNAHLRPYGISKTDLGIILRFMSYLLYSPNNENLKLFEFYKKYINFYLRCVNNFKNETQLQFLKKITSLILLEVKGESSFANEQMKRAHYEYNRQVLEEIFVTLPNYLQDPNNEKYETAYLNATKVMKNGNSELESAFKNLFSRNVQNFWDRLKQGFSDAFIYHKDANNKEVAINLPFGFAAEPNSVTYSLLNFINYPRPKNRWDQFLFFFPPTFVLMLAKNIVKLGVEMPLMLLKEVPHYLFDTARKNYNDPSKSGLVKFGWGVATVVSGLFYAALATPWMLARAVLSPITSASAAYDTAYEATGSKIVGGAVATLSALVTTAAYALPVIFAGPIVGLLGIASIPFVGAPATSLLLAGLTKFTAMLAPIATATGVSATIHGGVIVGIATTLVALANWGIDKLSAKKASAIAAPGDPARAEPIDFSGKGDEADNIDEQEHSHKSSYTSSPESSPEQSDSEDSEPPTPVVRQHVVGSDKKIIKTTMENNGTNDTKQKWARRIDPSHVVATHKTLAQQPEKSSGVPDPFLAVLGGVLERMAAEAGQTHAKETKQANAEKEVQANAKKTEQASNQSKNHSSFFSWANKQSEKFDKLFTAKPNKKK